MVRFGGKISSHFVALVIRLKLIGLKWHVTVRCTPIGLELNNNGGDDTRSELVFSIYCE